MRSESHLENQREEKRETREDSDCRRQTQGQKPSGEGPQLCSQDPSPGARQESSFNSKVRVRVRPEKSGRSEEEGRGSQHRGLIQYKPAAS